MPYSRPCCRTCVIALNISSTADSCRTRSRCNGRLPASLADEPCHVGGQSTHPTLGVEQARNPGPFADVKPKPPPMSRVTSDEHCIPQMLLLLWMFLITAQKLMLNDLETLDEAGCLPAIASYEGQLAFSVATNAVLYDTRATVLLVYRHVALSSVCISYRNLSTAPRPLQHAPIMQPIPEYMNCGCAAAVAREAGMCQCVSSVAVVLPEAARSCETAALYTSPIIHPCTCLVGVSSASCFTSANAKHRA